MTVSVTYTADWEHVLQETMMPDAALALLIQMVGDPTVEATLLKYLADHPGTLAKIIQHFTAKS